MTAPTTRSAGGRHPRPDAELVHPPPRGRARLLVSAFIGAWLLGQLAVPASYHVNPNASQERFAWRMFSNVWWYHKTCRLSLVETLDAPGAAGDSLRREVARPPGAPVLGGLPAVPGVVTTAFALLTGHRRRAAQYLTAGGFAVLVMWMSVVGARTRPPARGPWYRDRVVANVIVLHEDWRDNDGPGGGDGNQRVRHRALGSHPSDRSPGLRADARSPRDTGQARAASAGGGPVTRGKAPGNVSSRREDSGYQARGRDPERGHRPRRAHRDAAPSAASALPGRRYRR